TETARRLGAGVLDLGALEGAVDPDAGDVDVDAADLEPGHGPHGVRDPGPERSRELGDIDPVLHDQREDDADLALAQVDANPALAQAEAEPAGDALPDREAPELDDARHLPRFAVDDGGDDLLGDQEL